MAKKISQLDSPILPLSGSELMEMSQDSTSVQVTFTEFLDNVGVITSHGELSGLGADDHTQYLPIDGTRSMVGDLTVASDLIHLGIDDNTAGELKVYGDGGGSFTGGVVSLYTPVDYDATIERYVIQANRDNFQIGPITDADSFGYSGASDKWAFTVPVAAVGGLEVGLDDVIRGTLSIYGDTTGGLLEIYTSSDHDGTIDWYALQANEDDLIIGPSTNPDSLKYDGANSKWVFEDPVEGTGGYVDRGDPSANDFTQADLTEDATWRDLDLSSVVPAGAIAVHLSYTIEDDAVESRLSFRKNGNVNEFNRSNIRTQVADILNDGDTVVSCDANRIIEYYATNTTWTSIAIKIRGWYI